MLVQVIIHTLILSIRRHSCPHYPQANIVQSNQMCCITEYTDRFQKYLEEQRRSIKKPPYKKLTQDGKMASETTNRKDFIAHPVAPPIKRPLPSYQAPIGSMNTSTEYATEFLGKWADPAQLILPLQTEKSTPQPFNNPTTHMIDYVAPPVTPRKLYKAQVTYEPPNAAFDATSTTHSDYSNFGAVPVTQNFRPPHKVAISEHPFEGNSTYNLVYTTPDIPEKFVRPKVAYVPSNKKFSNSTTFRSDFPRYPDYGPIVHHKPTHKVTKNTIPFEGITTHNANYKAWGNIKRPGEFRQSHVYKPPNKKFDGISTFQDSYRGTYVPRPSSCRPPVRLCKNSSKMESVTIYRENYSHPMFKLCPHGLHLTKCNDSKKNS